MVPRSFPFTHRVPASLVPARALTCALALALFALAFLSAGCRTYATKTESVRYSWQAGQVDQAVRAFSERADGAPTGRDSVIWRLEQAAALRVAGKFQESTVAFEQAEARMNDYANRAKAKVATEAMAAMTTPANFPYEGRAYDKIMAATYRALNHLALGQPEKARPALIKAYQYQQDAVAENARRIERAQDDARSSSHAANVNATRNNPQFQGRVQSLYSDVAALKPYAEYVNPFTVWLDGAFFLATAQDGSDLERARKSLERALAFNPGHPAIAADVEACQRRLRGERPAPVTYVIFENGRAPVREQVRIDIPIVFANVSYLGTAWPVLRAQGGQAPGLAVLAGGQRFDTRPVASMDSMISRDFEDEKPAIITRTIISTLAKGAAAFVANEAASQQDEGLGALVRIATLAYQASVNIADTRTWTTLPKEFQLVRIPTPADRRITVVEGARAPFPVTLEDGLANLVYVHSVSGHAPLRVSQCRIQ